jgi:hypothetical protein
MYGKTRRWLTDWRGIQSRSEFPGAVALAAAGCAAIFAFAIYVRTMAPTVTWRNAGADSGDLVTAAINLGVPHPTGYPLYTMIAHLFASLPGAEPARYVNLLSALASALAVAATFGAAYWLIATEEGTAGVLTLTASWAAAGLYAFGELLWSQATIAEVYSLNAFLVALLLAIALSGGLRARPYVLALLFGLGLAHHATIVLLLPALWPYVPAIRRWLTGKRFLGIVLCLLPGLLAYLYIPVRASAHPVPNWGRADNLTSFIWLVSGAVYRPYLRAPSLPFVLQRVSAWVGIWVRNLGVPGLALALLGLWRGLETKRRFDWFGLTYVFLLSLYAMLYVTIDSYLYLIAAAVLFALWMARGAFVTLQALQDWAGSRPGPGVTLIGVAIIALLPVLSLVTGFHAMDLSADYEAYAFADGVLQAADADAVVISDGDEQTFSLWYLRYGLRRRQDVMVVDRRLLAFDWYREGIAKLHSELATVTEAHDAQSAITILIQGVPRDHPIHLAFSDDIVLSLARWAHQDPLYTLVRE